MLKKFNNNDIFVNKIKTYPKVRVFTYSGSMYYNNNSLTGSGVSLYDFLPEPQTLPGPPPVIEDVILLESGDNLVTEDGDNIIIEAT
jgi:hypothetical protein